MQIHVIDLQPSTTAPGQWDMCNPTCVGVGSYPDIQLDAGTGGATIIFNIDPAKTAVTFPAKIGDALWIKPANKPSAPVIAPAGQLGTPILLNGNRTLIINDKNSGKGADLYYRLNFSDGTKIDPVIKNGGGGGRSMDAVTYALVGALVGAIVSILFVRIVMNWRRAG